MYVREQFKKPLCENISDSTNGVAAMQWQLKINGSTARGWVQIEPLANGDFYVQGIDNDTVTPYFGIYTLDSPTR